MLRFASFCIGKCVFPYFFVCVGAISGGCWKDGIEFLVHFSSFFRLLLRVFLCFSRQMAFLFRPKSIRFQAKAHFSLAGMSFAFKPKSALLQFKGRFTLSRIPFFFNSNVIPLLIKSRFTSDTQAFCSFASSCTSFLLST